MISVRSFSSSFLYISSCERDIYLCKKKRELFFKLLVHPRNNRDHEQKAEDRVSLLQQNHYVVQQSMMINNLLKQFSSPFPLLSKSFDRWKDLDHVG